MFECFINCQHAIASAAQKLADDSKESTCPACSDKQEDVKGSGDIEGNEGCSVLAREALLDIMGEACHEVSRGSFGEGAKVLRGQYLVGDGRPGDPASEQSFEALADARE